MNGMIKLDSKFGGILGFTSDKFCGGSYLWRDGNTIIISFIHAKKRGIFRQLIKNIEANGFDFQIPTPSARMMSIGIKQGWRMDRIYCEDFGEEVEFLTNKKEVAE